MGIKLLFVLFLTFAFNGCVSKDISSIDIAKEHMIESENLRLLMRELDLVVYDRLKSELDRDNVRRRYAMNLADTIKELSQKIDKIVPEDISKSLTPEKAKIYHRYAQKLYLSGQEIYDVAENYELEKLTNKIDNMQSICISCHNQFRKE